MSSTPSSQTTSTSILAEELSRIVSEGRNPETTHMDTLSTEKMLACINREDAKVAEAVKQAIPAIAKAVDAATSSLKKGGRLIYLGGWNQWPIGDFRCRRMQTYL